MPLTHPRTMLCADWGKEPNKRAVYAAHVSARVVRRVESAAWTVAGALAEAARWTKDGPVLLAFDAPLGVPSSYLAAVARSSPSTPPANFVELLRWALTQEDFYRGTSQEGDWCVERPFFSVPPGEGGLKRYAAAAAVESVELFRAIDRSTKANPVFAQSGIPGSVGSAAKDIWRALGPLLGGDRSFQVWPFEGLLPALLESGKTVLAEVYPRAAYATALLDGTADQRPRLSLAKTQPEVRAGAIAALKSAHWVRQCDVKLEGLDHALESEDDFDACLTAAALLRCTLEELPFHGASLESPTAEGGILGTGTVNFELSELSGLPTKGEIRVPTVRTVGHASERVETLKLASPRLPSVDAGEDIPTSVEVVLNDNGGVNVAANKWLARVPVPCRLVTGDGLEFTIEGPFAGRTDMFRLSPSTLTIARKQGFEGAHLSRTNGVSFRALLMS